MLAGLFLHVGKDAEDPKKLERLAPSSTRKKSRTCKDEDKIIEEGGNVNGQLQPGIEQVRAELNKLTVDRQRVWYKCDPQVSVKRDTHTATIKVTIDQPNPSGIANKSILYAFEDVPAAQQGRYLGEFKVTAVSDKDKQITLEPAYILTPADEKNWPRPRNPGIFTTRCRHDNHEIHRSIKRRRVRLGDYGYLFDVYRMKITELVDRQESAMRDKQMVEDTLADAKLQVQYWQKQGTVVKAISGLKWSPPAPCGSGSIYLTICGKTIAEAKGRHNGID